MIWAIGKLVLLVNSDTILISSAHTYLSPVMYSPTPGLGQLFFSLQ